MRPKTAVPIGHTNVTGTSIQRAASIIALADQISGTKTTDADIVDVLERLNVEPTTIAVAAVRAILKKAGTSG